MSIWAFQSLGIYDCYNETAGLKWRVELPISGERLRLRIDELSSRDDERQHNMLLETAPKEPSFQFPFRHEADEWRRAGRAGDGVKHVIKLRIVTFPQTVQVQSNLNSINPYLALIYCRILVAN